MRAGYAKYPITPLISTQRLAGYIKRKDRFTCVLDDIYVKTFMLEIGSEMLVLSSIDILAIDNPMFDDLSKIIRDITGSENFIIAATHTHSAPATLFRDIIAGIGLIEFDSDYYQHFVSMFEKSIIEAYNRLSKVQCRSTTTIIKDIASNRNNPNDFFDDRAVLVECTSNHGIMGILNYNVHPTVLGPENKCISRDLAGSIEDSLKNTTGHDYIFLNGAAADVSTRFTRKNRSYDEVLRLGALFANNLLLSLNNARWVNIDGEEMITRKEKIGLKVDMKKLESIANIKSIKGIINGMISSKDMHVLESIEEALEALRIIYRSINYSETAIEVSAYVIGHSLGIIIFPGEALSRLSAECREITGIDVLFAGYANGYYGYFSDKFPLSTYEDIMTLFTHESVERVYNTIRRLCLWIGGSLLS
jgi:hypothetical protein